MLIADQLFKLKPPSGALQNSWHLSNRKMFSFCLALALIFVVSGERTIPDPPWATSNADVFYRLKRIVPTDPVCKGVTCKFDVDIKPFDEKHYNVGVEITYGHEPSMMIGKILLTDGLDEKGSEHALHILDDTASVTYHNLHCIRGCGVRIALAKGDVKVTKTGEDHENIWCPIIYIPEIKSGPKFCFTLKKEGSEYKLTIPKLDYAYFWLGDPESGIMEVCASTVPENKNYFWVYKYTARFSPAVRPPGQAKAKYL